MAVKMVLSSLDDVPEALKGFYKEANGVFVFDAEGIDDHPEVKTLKNAYNAEKEKRKTQGTELQSLKDRFGNLPEDFTADEFTRLKTEEEARLADPENKDLNKRVSDATNAIKAQFETRIANMERKHNESVSALDGTLKKKDGTIRSLLVEEGLTKALISAGVKKPTYLKAAKTMLSPLVDVVEDEGEYSARMKTELGGDEIDAYVKNWVQTEEGKDFIEQASGGDGQGGRGGNGGGSYKPAALGGNREERVKALAAKFPDLKNA